MQSEMPEWSSVRKMTMKELFAFLERNQEVDPHLLAIVCSEMLRRDAVLRSYAGLKPEGDPK